MDAPEPLAQVLQRILSAWLEVNPETRRQLGALEGKTVALEITGTGLTFYLHPVADGIKVSGTFEGTPDTRLSGTPWALAAMQTNEHADRTFFSGDVRIEGDLELGQQFRNILGQAEIDWEEMLAQHLGDPVAHQTARAARAVGAGLKQSGETLTASVSEYMSEEARLLPSRIEVDNLMTDIDKLRDDTERLIARIERLEHRGK